LRRARELEALNAAFAACAERADHHGLRIVHYSVQTNHLHLIVEARDASALSRGMQGLLVRIARGLNRLWRRSGPVFADRYEARALRSPREVRHVLAYVLNNARKHGCFLAGIDPYTSGRVFDGWSESSLAASAPSTVGLAPPVLPPRTWLLACGWRRSGLIDAMEIPGRMQRALCKRSGSPLLDMSALRRAARIPKADPECMNTRRDCMAVGQPERR
jgi:REP element-mobilizing transposase RayT